MFHRLRGQRGQTAAEYAGLLAILALVFAVLYAVDLPQKLRDAVETAVCSIEGRSGCGGAGGGTAQVARPGDPDGDGLTNRQERRLGTSTRDGDTDGDGVPDGVEADRGLDPRSRDTDRDGIQDAREIQLARTEQTDPRKADSDGDGLLDGAELAAGTPAGDGDADRDGLGGLGDGLSDSEEIFRHGTDPTRRDTDGDGADDGDEVRAGTNPLVDERSLGDKLGPEVAAILLDDPFGLGKGGALKKLGKGLDDLAAKLGIKAGKRADEAITETAENVAAARRRRAAAERAAGSRPPAPKTWLRGTHGNAGPVPDAVKRKLAGRSYSSPDQFRETFWRTVADDPDLAGSFSAANVTRMRQGLAPVAPATQHYGKHPSYVLHHRTPVARGGSRYDPDNIVVVTPRLHQEILDGTYHFGNGGP